MEHLTLTLACGHVRHVTLDTNGKRGNRVGRAAQLARAFLKPCLICEALIQQEAYDDWRESVAALQVTDKRGKQYAD